MMSRRTTLVSIAMFALVAVLAAAALIVRDRGSELALPAYLTSSPATGEIREFRFVAAATEGSLAPGMATELWTYNGTVPGPELRVTLGDTVRVVLENQLPEATSIHWHGVRVPHSMDGVPGVTQPAIEPGETFIYEFTPPDAGTYSNFPITSKGFGPMPRSPPRPT